MLWFTLREIKSQDPKVRRAAAQKLGESTDQRALDALIHALDDEDHHVREEAVNALARFRSDDAVSKLKERLHDEVSAVRKAALLALRGILGTNSMDLLVGALQDKDEHVRAVAIRGLAQFGGEISLSAAKALLSGLHDESERVRDAAKKALESLRSPLAKKGDAAAQFLEEMDVELELAAIASDMRTHLKEIEGDLDSVRYGATFHAQEEVWERIHAWEDENAATYTARFVAIGPRVVGGLLRLANEWSARQDSFFSKASFEALVQIGEPAVDGLMAVFDDYKRFEEEGQLYGEWTFTPEIRQYAARALGRIGDRRAVEPLTSALSPAEREIEVRRSAADALALIKDPDSIDALEEALGHSDFDALFKMGVVRALSALDRKPSGVQESAFEVMARRFLEPAQISEEEFSEEIGRLGAEALVPLRRALEAFQKRHDSRTRIEEVRKVVENIESSGRESS